MNFLNNIYNDGHILTLYVHHIQNNKIVKYDSELIHNLLLWVFKDYIIRKNTSWELFKILRLLKYNKDSALFKYEYLNHMFTEKLTFNKWIVIQRSIISDIDKFSPIHLQELLVILFSVTNKFYDECDINQDILFLSLGHIYKSRCVNIGQLYQEYQIDLLNIKDILVSGFQVINKYISSMCSDDWLISNKNNTAYLTLICILASLSRTIDNEVIKKLLISHERVVNLKLKD